MKEGTTAEGDKVNVTYRATMNGESVEDSAEGKTQTIALTSEGFARGWIYEWTDRKECW